MVFAYKMRMGRASIAQPIAISSQLSNKLANMSLLCAFLVVVIHCYVDSEHGSVFWWLTEFFGGGRFASGGLVRIAVPYFFVAAGFLLAGHMQQRDWWIKECAKRVRSLVVPYIIWCGVFGLMILANKLLLHHEGFTLMDLRRIFGLGLGLRPYLIQCWFLRALFILVLISPILKGGCGRCAVLILSAIVLFAGEFGFVWFRDDFWAVTFSLEGFFYFSVGVFLRYHPLRVSGMLARLGVAALAIALLMAYATLDYRHSSWAWHCRFAMIPAALASI